MVKLWKDGKLKELSRGMFASDDEFDAAISFWCGEGWEFAS